MPSDIPYGGQAVINGVMIRGRSAMAIACRLADGSIRTHAEPIRPLSARSRFLSLPVIRGTPALIDALVIGFRALIWSADLATADEGHKPVSKGMWWLTIAGATAIGIVVFVLLPSLVVPHIGHSHLPASPGGGGAANAPGGPGGASGWWPAFVSNIVEGAIRMAVFLVYVLLIMRMREIQRIFQYHGAEHKVVNAFEAGAHSGDPGFSRIHRRCGTNFIATVIVVGIVVHLAFGWPAWYWRLPIRIASLPIIAGISYELLRAAGKRPNSRLYALLVAPGLVIQRLTTKEPTPDQIEVAQAALDAALSADKTGEGDAERPKARDSSPARLAGEEKAG